MHDRDEGVGWRWERLHVIDTGWRPQIKKGSDFHGEYGDREIPREGEQRIGISVVIWIVGWCGRFSFGVPRPFHRTLARCLKIKSGFLIGLLSIVMAPPERGTIKKEEKPARSNQQSNMQRFCQIHKILL